MNYRHAFHAGNFADLVKHAALLWLLDRWVAQPSPLTIVDTHAGAGLYDLSDPSAVRSGEASEGVLRLCAADPPAALAPLAAAVRALNPGAVASYPGSPWLICSALRQEDSYVACELREDDYARLEALLRGTAKPAVARPQDGYEVAVELALRAPGQLFLLIDPPFEQADDYLRIAETLERITAIQPSVRALVWLPLKDLETLDAFARDLERRGLGPGLIAEARLRPLTNPLRLNGCAVMALRPPDGFEAAVQAICAAVVDALGGPGGMARTWRLSI